MSLGLVHLTTVDIKSFTVDMWVNSPGFHSLRHMQASGHYKITELYTLAKEIRLFRYRREYKKSKTPEAMQNGVTVLCLVSRMLCT
jgi:hypothetical protein